jgi:hypothetical protein
LIFLFSATAEMVRTIQLPSAAETNSTGQKLSRPSWLLRLMDMDLPLRLTLANPFSNLVMVFCWSGVIR